jgi:hypothetical protein
MPVGELLRVPTPPIFSRGCYGSALIGAPGVTV